MNNNSDQVTGSPFDKVHRVAFEFALNIHEAVLFKQLYEVPETREAAVKFLITSPKMTAEKPN